MECHLPCETLPVRDDDTGGAHAARTPSVTNLRTVGHQLIGMSGRPDSGM